MRYVQGIYYPRRRKTLADRFWPKVDKSGDCWVWTGALTIHGYGELALPGPPPRRPMRAHRIAWALVYGPIPDGLAVLHRCDNPPCVRPDHLFLGTKADNSRDMTSKGRHRSVLPEHIRKGTEIPVARLTEDVIPTIRAARRAGESYETIAKRYGVNPGTVRYAVLRTTWKHVP